MKKRDIFEPRDNFKPFEYPEMIKYGEAIQHSYWLHSEFLLTKDISEFHTQVTPHEKEVISRAATILAQIELSVKSFWSNIFRQLPKPEVLFVGSIFAESEARHSMAYSVLLEKLGLNEKFEQITSIPVIMDRISYLKRYKDFVGARLEKNYLKSLILFSIFIESVSLFGQFFIISSFNKHKKIFTDISTIILATSKEENLHFSYGAYLVNILKEENPEFFDQEMIDYIKSYSLKAFEHEQKVTEWIFDGRDMDFITREEVNEYIKFRLNTSLNAIGIEPIFEVDENLLAASDFFENSIHSTTHQDFFECRSVNYNKKSKPISADSLFD